jgi:hypothetical protein
LSESFTLPSSKNRILKGSCPSVNNTVVPSQKNGAERDSNSLIASDDKDLKNSPALQLAAVSVHEILVLD